MNDTRSKAHVAAVMFALILAGCQQLPIAAPQVTADCQIRAPASTEASRSGFGLGLGIPIATGGAARSPSTTESSAYTEDYDGEPMKPKRERRSGGGVGIGIGLDLESLLRESGEPDLPRQLAENGPQIPANYSMSCMPIRGFVRGGWPMVIDYEPDGASLVTVEVHLADRDRPFVFPLEGEGRRHLLKFELPATLGNTTRPAIVLVRAIKDQPGAAALGKLRLYGLGVGPRAVGSVAIEQVDFGPATVRLSLKQKAVYRFFSHSDFNRVAAEVLRLQSKDGEIQVSLAYTHMLTGGVSRGSWVGKPQPRTWDGTDSYDQVSQGLHLLQIRAWLGSQDQGDWVSAWSADTVLVSQ